MRNNVIKLICFFIIFGIGLNEIKAQSNNLAKLTDRISTSIRFSYRVKSNSNIAESSLGIEYSSFDYSTISSFEFGIDFKYKISRSLGWYLSSFYSEQDNKLLILTPLFNRDDNFPPFEYDVKRDFINFATGLEFSLNKHSVRIGYSRLYALQNYFDVVPGRVTLLTDLFFDPNTNRLEGVAIGTQWSVQYSRGARQYSGANISYGYEIVKNLELIIDNQINFWGKDLLFFWISEGDVPGHSKNTLVDQFEISNRYLFHSVGLKFTL